MEENKSWIRLALFNSVKSMNSYVLIYIYVYIIHTPLVMDYGKLGTMFLRGEIEIGIVG